VGLPPLEREDLARHAPAGDVGKGHDASQLLGQLATDGLKLRVVEQANKPERGAALAQHGEVRPDQELSIDGAPIPLCDRWRSQLEAR
jgi:hypothetical protein